MATDLETKVAVIENTIGSHNDRITSLHGRVGEAQVQISGQTADIKLIKKEVEDSKEDFKEFKEKFDKTITEMRRDFDKKFETLTTAARWGTGTMITALGVLVALLVKGG